MREHTLKKQKMKEKNRFQRELERHVSKQIILTILIGCFFFCVAMLGITMIDQRIKQSKYMDAVEAAFWNIWDSSRGFLMSEENMGLFLKNVNTGAEEKRLRYQLGTFNIEAPVGIRLIIMNAEGDVKYSSFPEEEMNLHRIEFNRAAGGNAGNQEGDIYSTVYFFSGDISEYVLMRPLFDGENFAGTAAVYLEPSDWNLHFQKYQYDVILTNYNSDVIYCSNYSFLEGHAVNRYNTDDQSLYQQFGDDRYLTDSRYLEEAGVRLYSFIYAPGSSTYLLIGIAVILGLGFVWAGMFFHLMHVMAEKTSQSVGKLIGELRTVQKGNPDHAVKLETGDEFEEIAGQINKMLISINELNKKNLDLVNINNRMEIQNLQAQINPHFIYNTLDNIRYLIIQDAKRADDLIERFTHILRYSIDNRKNRTMLSEDMEYIEDYLIIQKTRFGDRFQYTVEIGEECYPVVIPKLLLQPMIENSLKYGFKKQPAVRVWIKGFVIDEYLILRVEDDGPGLPQPTLEVLRGILNSEQIDYAHNGLQNTNRRISLEYGHDSGITLDAREGDGFTVTLRLWIGGEN